MENQNTLFLCGLEYEFQQEMGMDSSVSCMADDVVLVVASSRSQARRMLHGFYKLYDYMQPITIRKVCLTNLEAGMLDYEDCEDFYKLAYEKVEGFCIPFTRVCHPALDYRKEDRQPEQAEAG